MSDVVIRAENVYKEYNLGTIGYGTLYQDLQSWWARVRGKDDPNAPMSLSGKKDYKHGKFYALSDVSFDINRGDLVGIIGRNGAGKSTLLKILSRITTPTKGQIKVKGRIASLLEVGTGFHAELTGRENIYLNGTILGMKKREIDRKLDEIVAFAGIEEFIDTPVKRYSSGMYVRLAFSVAAHLDSDILILDEVLAVGDAEFQKKCLGKMDDVAKNQGRTVLFVSHNMGAVRSLCSCGFILNKGKLESFGNIQSVVAKYISYNESSYSEDLLSHPNREKGMDKLLVRFYHKCKTDKIYYNEPITFYLEYDFKQEIINPEFCIIFFTNDGHKLFTLVNGYQESKIPQRLIGKGCIVCDIKKLPLIQGDYIISLKLWQPGQKLDDIEFAYAINVEIKEGFGDTKWNDNGMGDIYVNCNWSVQDNKKLG